MADCVAAAGGSYMPPMTGRQWASLPRTLVAAVEMIARPPLAGAATPSSSTSVISDDFDRYWTFLNNPRVKTVDPNRETTVSGWYYDSQSTQWPVFKAYAAVGGQEIPLSLTRQASPDLQRYFSDDRPAHNRFQMMFRCPDTCAIAALISDRSELRLALDRNQGLSVASGSARLYVDSMSGNVTGFINRGEELAASARFGLIRLYNGLLPFLLLVGLIAAVAASWRAVRVRALHAVLLTALAAWALVATRIVLLALIDVSSFPAISIDYSAPANYLAIVAAFLSIAAIAETAPGVMQPGVRHVFLVANRTMLLFKPSTRPERK